MAMLATAMEAGRDYGGSVSLSRGCLTLNASFEPLTVVPAKRAIRLILDGKAEVVEADDRRMIRSESAEIPYPVVIRLVSYVHVPRRFRRHVTNTFLFARDHYTCAYCGRHRRELRNREFLTRDHVFPRSRGGEDSWANCVTSCSSCNCKKDNRTPEEAGMTLRIVPSEPHFVKLAWAVRRLTPLQRKYIARFYGDEVLDLIERR